ncbi:MAG: MBL fold metallo-hydrolase [Candidatus Hydrogenedentes bacterium]|nr:MBL fold metallo-hydrolase [Candidatus Hydrogenedentota bacterium]
MVKIIPKLAGASVIWRRGRKDSLRDIEVLMIKRTRTLTFLPGHHAFPGGSLEDIDDPAIVVGEQTQEVKRALVTALRETFEETGYFPFPKELIRCIPESLQNKDISSSKTFYDLLKSSSIVLDIKSYPFTGPWITPPGYPLRFKTYFFFVEWKEDYMVFDIQSPKEVESIEWYKPSNALEKWHKGEISLSTPVAYILEHLNSFQVEIAISELKVIPWADEKYSYFHPRAGVHIFPLPSPKETFFSHVNCVVIGGKELIIIDPGAGDTESVRELLYWLQHLAELGATFIGVTYTHPHEDHAGSVELISRCLKIPILHHGKMQKTSETFFTIKLDKDELPWSICVIPTPGHIPDHYSFYELTTKTLVAGDMVSAEGPVVINTDEGGDMAIYMESLKLLSELEVDLLIPGHGVPFFFMRGNQVIHNLIEHRKRREEKILKALKNGVSSIRELLSQVYDDIPQERIELAKQQLKAHLILLKNKGVPLNLIYEDSEEWF